MILITTACSNEKEVKLKVIKDSITNNLGSFLESYSPVGWSKLEKVKYELWYSDSLINLARDIHLIGGMLKRNYGNYDVINDSIKWGDNNTIITLDSPQIKKVYLSAYTKKFNAFNALVDHINNEAECYLIRHKFNLQGVSKPTEWTYFISKDLNYFNNVSDDKLDKENIITCIEKADSIRQFIFDYEIQNLSN